MARPIEYPAGTKFGDWTVIKELSRKVSAGGVRRMMLCACTCGAEKAVQLGNLKNGSTKRCEPCALKGRAKQWRGPRVPDGSVNRLQAFRAYQRDARRRAFACDLMLEEWVILSQQDCHYCGAPPSNVYNLKHSKGELKGQPRAGAPFIYNGVDRVDSTKGYSKDNCVACCWDCNIAKNDMGEQQFYAWLERVYRHTESRRRNTVVGDL